MTTTEEWEQLELITSSFCQLPCILNASVILRPNRVVTHSLLYLLALTKKHYLGGFQIVVYFFSSVTKTLKDDLQSVNKYLMPL